jgi:archaellum biogenesis ATPase FlaH
MTSFLIITAMGELQGKINSVIKSLKNFPIIYVSLNKSQWIIDEIFEKKGLNSDKLFFIDCVTSEKTKDDVLRIDPSRLELLNSAIVEFIKDIKGKKILIIDSLSTLLIYNNKNKVAEFIKEIIEYCYQNHVEIIAFSPKTKEEELLAKIFNFFDKVFK